MSTTVLEALENAKFNFEQMRKFNHKNPIYVMAMEQLNNAIKALGNDLSPHAIIQEHMFDQVNTGDNNGTD